MIRETKQSCVSTPTWLPYRVGQGWDVKGLICNFRDAYISESELYFQTSLQRPGKNPTH